MMTRLRRAAVGGDRIAVGAKPLGPVSGKARQERRQTASEYDKEGPDSRLQGPILRIASPKINPKCQGETVEVHPEVGGLPEPRKSGRPFQNLVLR